GVDESHSVTVNVGVSVGSNDKLSMPWFPPTESLSLEPTETPTLTVTLWLSSTPTLSFLSWLTRMLRSFEACRLHPWLPPESAILISLFPAPPGDDMLFSAPEALV